jgi:hypothetical protein
MNRMTIRRCMAGALLGLLLTMPVLAADAPPKGPVRKRWQPAAAAVILLLAAGTVSIMGSKRGHQD